MMLTEEEAKQKWCPMYRMVLHNETLWDNRSNNQGYCRCEASGCMAWRYGEEMPYVVLPQSTEKIEDCNECGLDFMVPHDEKEWRYTATGWQCPRCGHIQKEAIDHPERRRGYCGLAGKPE